MITFIKHESVLPKKFKKLQSAVIEVQIKLQRHSQKVLFEEISFRHDNIIRFFPIHPLLYFISNDNFD